uniref:Uncharacterized protein n=1 Tax=Astyanax mexicanus TaxID=7994 RepID=A0A8B9HUW7_ASTMX
ILLKHKHINMLVPLFLRYRWVKDGTLYVEESSITANETDDLKSYQGKYRCYVSNELGTAMSDEIELITDSTPILPKEKRVRKTVHEGDSVVLHCNPPNSSVTPYIHWMDRKLMHIPQSDRVTIGLDGNLYFANVLNKDTRDDYTCNAQYSAARTILPKEPISLHVTPSNMVVKSRRPHLHRPEGKRSQYLALRGEPLTLECIPHGLPTPTVTWTRKDGPLETSDLITVSRYNHRLEFREVLESDDGEYSCTASNTQGSITHSYTVTVEAAPYWTKVPENQRYAPGETVKLDCQAEGIPTPNITWKINGIPITETDGDQRRSIVGGTLRLTNVRYGDTAVYQCEASNKHGTSLVNAFIHIVELPPQILTEDKVMYNLTEGSSVFLDCRAFGSPPPKITCVELENVPQKLALENARATQFANGSLQITDVMREDSGMYFCSVKNLSISATLALRLIIIPIKDILAHLILYILSCIYCILSSAVNFNITLHNTINQKKNHNLIDFFSFWLFNQCVFDWFIFFFDVCVDKPDAPHSLRLSEKSSRSVTLSWIPGNENNSPVSEYVIEVREEMHGLSEVKRVSAEMNHLEIPLLPFCTYNFRVTAVNDIGTSDFSLPSESYTTPPAKPDKNPGSVRSESTDPKSMVITWEEVDRRHFNGPGFRYKVMWRQAAGQGPKWNEDFVSHPPFTVNNTDTFSAFEIKVQALNDLGHGPSPAPKLGHSGEDTPLKPPTGVAVNQYNDTAVTITWTAVDRESVRGHLLGYKVHTETIYL